jgi:hypothetical protein
MPNKAVWTSRDYFLLLFDLNDARGEAVGVENPKGDQVARKKDGLGKKRKPQRNMGPAESEVQPGDQKSKQKNHGGPLYDLFLRGDRLLALQAARHQRRVAFEEVKRGEGHGNKYDRDENPGLPITQ